MKRWPLLVAGILIAGSAASIARADPLNSVAKKLAKAAAHLPNKRIAVLIFPYHDGGISSGSSIISEHLTTLLVGRKGVSVVERSLLNQVLSEMKLEESGATDPSSAQKLGKILNVGAVVTGTLIDLEDNETEVNARLIQAETGEILAAATATLDRTWPDAPRPPPVVEKDDDTDEPVHMSALIPTHPGPGRRRFGGHAPPPPILYNALYTPGPSGDLPASTSQLSSKGQ